MANTSREARPTALIVVSGLSAAVGSATPADDSRFTPIKTAFAGMPAALTMAERAAQFRETFRKIGESIRLTDVR